MVKFVKTKMMLTVLAGMIFLSLEAPNVLAVSPEIMERCKKDWGDNYQMVEHCVKTQEEAKARLGL